MTARLAHTPIRESVKVSTVAHALECDESQVRRLIDSGELEAHRNGVRGVRVYLDSLDAYRARGAIKPKKGRKTPAIAAGPSPASRAAHNAALAQLRALGLV